MADIQIHFLDPINEFLGKPQFASPHAGMLSDFDDLPEEALRAAAEKAKEQIRGKAAPSVGTLKKFLVAQRHKAEVYTAARMGPDPWDFEAQQRLHYARRKDACFKARCNLGRRADKEGWLCAMLDFIEDEGRIPEGREIDALIVKAKRSESRLADMRGEAFYASTVALRLNMLERASIDVFGDDEAIKRSPDSVLLQGQQGRRAGSSQKERIAASERLKEMEGDYEPLSASPLLKKALGLPTRGRTERRFVTDDPIDKYEN